MAGVYGILIFQLNGEERSLGISNMIDIFVSVGLLLVFES